MSDRVRCSCRRCTIRGLTGPAVLITIGVLFLLNEMRGGFFSFSDTWPVILIVIGIVRLASAVAPSDGHVTANPPQSGPPSAPGATPGQVPGQGQ